MDRLIRIALLLFMTAVFGIVFLPGNAAALPYLGVDTDNPVAYDAMVKDSGRSMKWVLRYIDDTYSSLDKEGMDNLVLPPRNINVMIVTLQIQANLADIIAGKRDDNLKKIAKEMADWQKAHPYVELMVRPFHEMNGDWYPWGFKDGHNGNSAAQFTPAWKHVRSVMRGEFPALPFMWCPNVMLSKNDNFASYYPGNDQTELLCLDGYNHSSAYGGWKTMGKIFDESLKALRVMPGVNASMPIVIAETGTTEPDAASAAKGHNKAEWFDSMGVWLHKEAPKYGVVAVLYFNYNKKLGDKPVDYLIYDPLIATGTASRDAFRKAVHDLP